MLSRCCVWLSFWLVVVLSLPSLALTKDEEAKVLLLKQNPLSIRQALHQGSDAPAAVRQYFLDLYKSSARIKAAVGDAREPLAFRKHLVWVVTQWFTTNELRLAEYRTTDNLLAMFAAFRDADESDDFRDYAFAQYRRHIVTRLTTAERDTVLNSLRQYAGAGSEENTRASALAALFLTVEEADFRRRLLELRSEKSDVVRRRSLDAISSSDLVRAHLLLSANQVTLASFLLDSDEWVKRKAAKALKLEIPRFRDGSPLQKNQQLSADALETLKGIIEHGESETSRILAMEVLGSDLEFIFAQRSERRENDAISLAIATRLAAATTVVEQLAALDALGKIVPKAVPVQDLVLQASVRGNTAVSRSAFEVLGVRNRNPGDHRISDEGLKYKILRALVAALGHTDGWDRVAHDRRNQFLLDSAEAIVRNPPDSTITYYHLIRALMRFGFELTPTERRTYDKLYGVATQIRKTHAVTEARHETDTVASILQNEEQWETMSGDNAPLFRELLLRCYSWARIAEADRLNQLEAGNSFQRLFILESLEGLSNAALGRMVALPTADLVFAQVMTDENVLVRRGVLRLLASHRVRLLNSPNLLAAVIGQIDVEMEATGSEPSLNELALAILQTNFTGATRVPTGTYLESEGVMRAMVKVMGEDLPAPFTQTSGQAFVDTILRRLAKTFSRREGCAADIVKQYLQRPPAAASEPS